MLGLTAPTAIYLCRRLTDMRKSIDGLCGEVSTFLQRRPDDGSLFVFVNRRRDKLKMLWWDGDGYWLLYKRLEGGTFQMPDADGGGMTHWSVTAQQLQLILGGIDLDSVRLRTRYRPAA